MSQPYGPPSPRRRPGRPRFSMIVAGVTAALVVDALAFAGLPSLAGIWGGGAGGPTPSRPATAPSPSAPAAGSPLPSTSGRPGSPRPSGAPRTARPVPAPSADRTARPARGQVPLTDDLARGVVLIETRSGGTSSVGTGMILTDDGQVLTNYHVVRSSTRIVVVVPESGRRYTARLVGRDATRDVALLDVAGASGLPTVTVDADPVSVGDRVVAAGNASGQGFITAFDGRVVATDQSIRVRSANAADPPEDLTGLVETDAHAEPGDSGGPLFDAQTEVLGMTTAGTGGQDAEHGTAFAIPIATALGIVDRIRAGDESGTVVIGPKPFLGVVIDEQPSNRTGIGVEQVVEDSPAGRAGLREGDRILALGGREVSSRSTLARALDELEPGDRVPLRWRDYTGRERSATITLDTAESN